MKVTAIESCVLTVPTPKPMALQYPQHKLVVAEIATDQGLRGLGYSLVFGGGGAEAVRAYLEARLKPALIGEDPMYVEYLWEKMFRLDMGMKKQGVAAYALSALDIGLWDITGKALGKPLYGVNHLAAHVAVDQLEHGPLPEPCLALLVLVANSGTVVRKPPEELSIEE